MLTDQWNKTIDVHPFEKRYWTFILSMSYEVCVFGVLFGKIQKHRNKAESDNAMSLLEF